MCLQLNQNLAVGLGQGGQTYREQGPEIHCRTRAPPLGRRGNAAEKVARAHVEHFGGGDIALESELRQESHLKY